MALINVSTAPLWPYEAACVNLARRLSHLGAADSYLSELAGGFLLYCMAPDGTRRVEVVDAAALDDLQAQAPRTRARGGAALARWRVIGSLRP